MKRRINKKQKITKGMPSAVLLSILIHAALFLLAGMLVVFTVVKKKEIEFEPPKAVERPKMKLKKPKPKVKKTSKPKQAKHILAKVNPVNMPEIQLPELSGMGGDGGLGDGFGGGFDTMPDLEDVSIFGGGQTIGNDFEGCLYNFNYDRNGRKIPMDPDTYLAAVRKFMRSGWQASKLARYYRSPRTLYTTHFMIPHIPTPIAPDVFGMPEKEGFNFAIHYKGQLVCPASYTNGITFRFRGCGDDFMAIRVDGKNVFIARWGWVASYFDDLWQSSSADDKKHYIALQPSTVGDWITLEPGQSVPMEVLFGEGTGGNTGMAIAVEVEGEEYNEKGWQGTNPIFPAFTTEKLSQDMIDQIQFYLPEGEVSLTNGPVFRDYGSSVAADDGDAAPGVVPPDDDVAGQKDAIPLQEGKMRAWTMEDGRMFEAEYVTRIGAKVVFKNAKGKMSKVPVGQISVEDRKYIELETPPELEFSFSKQSRKRDFPSAVNGKYDTTYLLPKMLYYDFSVDIRQTSAGVYNHELRAELFVVGSDLNESGKYILLDRQEGSFTLTKEGQRSFTLKGKKSVELSMFQMGSIQSGRQFRGRKYASYLVVVTDSRGEIIAHGAPKKWMFESLEKLRKLSVGNYFDNTCTRTGAPRPKPYYYDGV